MSKKSQKIYQRRERDQSVASSSSAMDNNKSMTSA